MAGEQLFELRRRTFDTPHFRGIEFIEVEAKSIINHVPGNFLPFEWTINPYRGCSHSCSYCLGAETPILMADGRTKVIADLRVGDHIYGTVFDGKYRRYVTTEVLDHWSTVKPAYRIRLEDGTQLIASCDHRFLSRRGWKHVTGTEQGRKRRPHLTINNKLMGTGRFRSPPKAGSDYRSGYLCGLIRGDGHLSSRLRATPDGLIRPVYRFRLALVDNEALRRARDYLNDLDIVTQEFVFQKAVGARKEMRAISAQSKASVSAIQQIVRWPQVPSDEWCKGFLAGIFDAEGSHSGGILRICNTEPWILDETMECLLRFGFSFAIEPTNDRKGLTYIRLRGGLQERLRFFLTVDPAITRKRNIEGFAIKGKAKLRVVSVEELGIEIPMYDITTGTGDFIANGVVSHNCFARVTHTYMDMNAGRDFETKIVVKVNAAQLLKRELRAKRWKGDHIAMGTATDPYQRAEGKYKLMPPIIGALTEVGNPFSILTKGTLILRDLDLLTEAARVTDVSTALSIGTLDEDAWRKSEPGTPHPRKRMEAVRRLNDAGIPCGVMVAPVLPGITDSSAQLKEVVTAAVDAGATHISPIHLHLRPVIKEVYMEWLEDTYPHLVGSYQEMYRRSAYGPSRNRKALGARVAALVRDAGGLKPKARSRRWRAPKESIEASPKAEQLNLISAD